MGKSKDDPFAVMEQDGFSLVHYGATVLAIPCNTAHYFYDRLAEALPVPVLNMPRLTVADAKAAGCTKLRCLSVWPYPQAIGGQAGQNAVPESGNCGQGPAAYLRYINGMGRCRSQSHRLHTYRD